MPQSGEIIGILKQLKDEMAKDKAETIAAEEAAIAAYKELMAAKAKEIAALTKMTDDKLTRIAQLGVEIATMKNDLTDSEEDQEAVVEEASEIAHIDHSAFQGDEQGSLKWIPSLRNRTCVGVAQLVDDNDMCFQDVAELEMGKRQYETYRNRQRR